MLKASTYIVRPAIAPANSSLSVRAHLERVDPVVGRAGVVLRQRADEGPRFDACDVARVRPRVETPGPQLLVQPDERAAPDHFATELVVFRLRSVHPVDGSSAARDPPSCAPSAADGGSWTEAPTHHGRVCVVSWLVTPRAETGLPAWSRERPPRGARSVVYLREAGAPSSLVRVGPHPHARSLGGRLRPLPSGASLGPRALAVRRPPAITSVTAS